MNKTQVGSKPNNLEDEQLEIVKSLIPEQA
jgi:hypothetical protein